MEPVSLTTALVIAGGTAAAQAGLSIAQAREQNRAINRSADSRRESARIESRRVAEAGALERRKSIAEARLVRGRLIAQSAEAGVGMDGSYQQLLNLLNNDTAISDQIIRRNAFNQEEALRAGLAADLTALAARRVSPFFAGLQGGIQGFSTGLSLGAGVNQLYAYDRAERDARATSRTT